MIPRIVLALVTAAAAVMPFFTAPAPGCAPCPPIGGKPVVNADQTVIILWDAVNNIEHLIRRAAFKSQADDFGFIVPTPTQPELEESGNDAFPLLLKLTEPEIRRRIIANYAFGCSVVKTSEHKSAAKSEVTVLMQKEVAGFKASVLAASSATALVTWLEQNGYAFSQQIEAWAKPYVEQSWIFTALKVASDAKSQGGHSGAAATVQAPALRLTFKTERPLFPYREPDPQSPAAALGAQSRLLRIYFIADGRYQGELTQTSPWTGSVAWAGKLTAADRTQALHLLKLPNTTGPAEWHLTEFEDHWPYKAAPADLYFSRDANQNDVRRPEIIHYIYWPVDLTLLPLVALLVGVLVWRWRRKALARRFGAN